MELHLLKLSDLVLFLLATFRLMLLLYQPLHINVTCTLQREHKIRKNGYFAFVKSFMGCLNPRLLSDAISTTVTIYFKCKGILRTIIFFAKSRCIL